MNYKIKIFSGNFDNSIADEKFNRWIADKHIEIINFQYQQARYGDHSIAILYTEKDFQ